MPSMRLKISVSGVRGVVGETLTPRLLASFGQAFGSYVGPGRVLVGRDTRVSGPMVRDAVFAGLLGVGCTPVDLGVLPIPSLQLRASRRADVRGAIAITASHNPAEWNALKLLTRDGVFLGPMQASELLDIYHQGSFARVPGDVPREPEYDPDAIEAHLDAVLGEVDVPAIRRARLRVAADCVNGAGAEATPLLLQRLGCRLSPLGCQPSGQFHRPPEPVPHNLGALCRMVRREQVAVGFAQDADADRLALVDARGEALEGDTMLALLVDLVLRRRPGPVVVNLSTTHRVEAVARRHGAQVFRSPVGEANVVQAMAAHGAVVGGEGSGGLIYPAIHTCRDSLIGIALVLEQLARDELTLHELVERLPRAEMVRHRLELPTPRARALLARLREQLEHEAELDLRDGVKAMWDDRWVHVRPSNTEPIVRVIAESPRRAQAEALAQRVLDEARQLQGLAGA